jgi:xanthine/uracil permease
MGTSREWVHVVSIAILNSGIATLIYLWIKKRVGVKSAISGFNVLGIALVCFISGLVRAFGWEITHRVPLLFLFMGVLVALAITTWITGSRMRQRIRRNLGRKATYADLSSIRTWMEVAESEQRNERNKPLG